MQEIPEPWATAMIEARMTDPRYDDSRPSMGRLAEAADLHTTTVSRMIFGRVQKPSQANVVAIAAALRKSPVEVSRWVRQARSVAEDYTPPAEVNLLTQRQQEALTELIRAMADMKDGEEHEPGSASNAQAGESPAPEGVIENAGFASPDGGPGEGASRPARRGPRRKGRA